MDTTSYQTGPSRASLASEVLEPDSNPNYHFFWCFFTLTRAQNPVLHPSILITGR